MQEDVDETRRTSCWGCGLVVELPSEAIPEGLTAADVLFVCGFCGATNHPDPRRQSDDEADGCCMRRCKRYCWLCCNLITAIQRTKRFWFRVAGCMLVGVVPVIVVFIGASALWLLPHCMWPGFPWHTAPGAIATWTAALWFEFQVLWNYFAAVLTPPGFVDRSLKVDYGFQAAGENGRLKGFSLCRHCRVPRPPRTYHCSVCDACVFNMDHHCPYVHNCVGYGNHRSFLLFLIYAVVGCLYAVGFAGYVGYSYRYDRCMRRALLWNWLTVESVIFVSFVLLAVLVIFIVGFLLTDQLMLLARGITTVEVAKGFTPQATNRALTLARWRAVLGPPWTWLVPRVGPAPHGMPAPGLVQPVQVPQLVAGAAAGSSEEPPSEEAKKQQ